MQSSSHNLITAIPRIVAVHILSDWIDLRTVVYVDTAICNKELRHYLMLLQKCPAFVLRCKRPIHDGDQCLHWLYKRSMRVSKLGNLHHTLRIFRQFAPKFGSHIVEAGIVDGKDDKFLNVMESFCPNLEILSINSLNGGEPLVRLFAACNKLHTLQVIMKRTSPRVEKFSIEAKLCPNLHTIRWCVVGSSAAAIASIVAAGASIRHLSLLHWKCLDIMSEISLIFGDNTRNLETLAIGWTDASKKNTNNANASVFSAIATRCPSLTEFDFSNIEVGEFHMNDVLRVVKRSWFNTITSLKMSFIVPRSHCCFNEMMGRCTKLTSLRIGFSGPNQNFYMTCVVGHKFEDIDFRLWHRLTTIEIRGTPNEKYFPSISRNAEHLQQLTLVQYDGALSDVDQILKVCADFRLLTCLCTGLHYKETLIYTQRWSSLRPKIMFRVSP